MRISVPAKVAQYLALATIVFALVSSESYPEFDSFHKKPNENYSFFKSTLESCKDDNTYNEKWKK